VTAGARKADSSASHLTASASKALKPCGTESQKSETLIPSLVAQAQQPAIRQKAAPELVGNTGGDEAKTEAHCQVTEDNVRLDRVDQQKNNKKTMDLVRLQKRLGPDHVALIHALKDVDPESPHGLELASIIESLDESCG
jgi:hypothetical protein